MIINAGYDDNGKVRRLRLAPADIEEAVARCGWTCLNDADFISYDDRQEIDRIEAQGHAAMTTKGPDESLKWWTDRLIMNKHTPGPWIVSADGCAGDRTFRFLVTGPHFGPGEKAQAVDDARLIAAAPELLEACRGLLAIADRYTGVGLREIAMARAAIKAAGGDE